MPTNYIVCAYYIRCTCTCTCNLYMYMYLLNVYPIRSTNTLHVFIVMCVMVCYNGIMLLLLFCVVLN